MNQFSFGPDDKIVFLDSPSPFAKKIDIPKQHIIKPLEYNLTGKPSVVVSLINPETGLPTGQLLHMSKSAHDKLVQLASTDIAPE